MEKGFLGQSLGGRRSRSAPRPGRGVAAQQAPSWTYDGMGAITWNQETGSLAVNDALGNPSGGASYANGESRQVAKVV